MPKRLLRPKNRRYIYGIALAVVPIAQVYGIINEATAPLVVALVSAVLVPTLAVAHTPPPEATVPDDDGRGLGE